MNRAIAILLTLLVFQFLFTIFLSNSKPRFDPFQSDSKLLEFDVAAVDRIVIESADKKPLQLRKENNHWILPDQDKFPASTTQIDAILKQLTHMNRSWPVATTKPAAIRFSVSENSFERKITFNKGEQKLAKLFIGSAPSYRKVHARIEEQDEIYAIEFSSYQLSSKAEDWQDKNYLKVKVDTLARADFNGFSLSWQDSKAIIEGLQKNEEVIEEELEKLIQMLTNLRFQSVLKKTPENTSEERPSLKFTLTSVSDDKVHYAYSKPEKTDYWILKTSKHPYLFKVDDNAVKSIKDVSRNSLVRGKKTRTSDNATDEATKKVPKIGVSKTETP